STRPAAKGMGWPWGQVSGSPSTAAMRSSTESLMACSSRHASSYTWSRGRPRMSLRRRSARRMRRTSLRASCRPVSVSTMPVPVLITRSLASMRFIISETEAGDTPRNSAILVTVTGGFSYPMSRMAFRYISAFSVLPMLWMTLMPLVPPRPGLGGLGALGEPGALGGLAGLGALSKLGAVDGLGAVAAQAPENHFPMLHFEIVLLQHRQVGVGGRIHRYVHHLAAAPADQVRVGVQVGLHPKPARAHVDQPDGAHPRQLVQRGIHRLQRHAGHHGRSLFVKVLYG